MPTLHGFPLILDSQKPIISHSMERGKGPFLLVAASRALYLLTVSSPRNRVLSGPGGANPWTPLPLVASSAAAAMLIVREAEHSLIRPYTAFPTASDNSDPLGSLIITTTTDTDL